MCIKTTAIKMKTNFIILIFGLTIHFQANASNKFSADSVSTTIQDTIYTLAEQMPQFPGGNAELYYFIDHNVKYPVKAQEWGIKGKVVLRLAVTKSGKIGKVEIVHSLDRDCDKEAVRVVKLLPDFIPGKQNGKNVAVWNIVQVDYNLL